VSGWNWALKLNRTHPFVMFVEDVNFLDKIKKTRSIFSNSKEFVPIAKSKRRYLKIYTCVCSPDCSSNVQKYDEGRKEGIKKGEKKEGGKEGRKEERAE